MNATIQGGLERETCSRCSGSGKHSYCQQYGDRCFKCLGKGVVLTKRGQAAADYLRTLRSCRADQLKPGDSFSYLCSFSGKNEKLTVESVTTKQDGCIDISTDKLILLSISPNSLFQLNVNQETWSATLIQALEYQSTLTKSGTPRKGRAS